jgi:hypothetical protein
MENPITDPLPVQEDRCGTGLLKAVTSEMIADPKREDMGIVICFYGRV